MELVWSRHNKAVSASRMVIIPINSATISSETFTQLKKKRKTQVRAAGTNVDEFPKMKEIAKEKSLAMAASSTVTFNFCQENEREKTEISKTKRN